MKKKKKIYEDKLSNQVSTSSKKTERTIGAKNHFSLISVGFLFFLVGLTESKLPTIMFTTALLAFVTETGLLNKLV